MTQHVLALEWASTLSGGLLLPLLVILVSAIGEGVRRNLKESRATKAETVARLDRQDETLAHHGSLLDGIQHETHTNSGSSIKDAVNRIERLATATNDKLDDHLKSAAYDLGRVNAFIQGAAKDSPPST